MQVSIENIDININIDLPPDHTSITHAFIGSLLRSPKQDAPSAEPEVSTPAQSPNAPPKIGDYWPGQGGIYAGVARGRDGERDYHLILSTEAPEEGLEWQAALERAKSVRADGHNDFAVPNRWESALLYANLQDQFSTDYWYWTSTQYSEDDAWRQDFFNGSQGSNAKSSERRVRFVRRSVL